MNFGKGLIIAVFFSAIIYLIWIALEFTQYKELQSDRLCDNVVFAIYFLLLWWGFS